MRIKRTDPNITVQSSGNHPSDPVRENKIKSESDTEMMKLDLHAQHIASCLPTERRETINEGKLASSMVEKIGITHPWKELGCVY